MVGGRGRRLEGWKVAGVRGERDGSGRWLAWEVADVKCVGVGRWKMLGMRVVEWMRSVR